MLPKNDLNDKMDETRAWLRADKIPQNIIDNESLKEILRFHEIRYYHLNSLFISDPEYDLLSIKLEHYVQ